MLPQALIRRLTKVVGKRNVLTRAGELLPFESDALTIHRAPPAAVVFLRTAEELRDVVRVLGDAGIPFVPRGAGTGLSGGALADGKVILELSRMNRILWVDQENRRARVQPGVVNAQLQETVARYGLMYAPDPSSQTVSTLGGNVAENSGGPHCLKYGVTTNHILGLDVVTPDGQRLELPGPLGPGYDLTGAFVGSEGTLGIAVEIEVNLVRQPSAAETLLAHFDEIEPASRAVSAIIAAGIVPAALEMIDRETLRAVEASIYAAGFPTDVAASLIVELDGPAAGLREQADEVRDILAENGAREVVRAEDEEDRSRFWKARKSAFGAMGRLAPELLVQDATVPRSRLPDVLRRVYEIAERHGLTVTNVFHAGDGNLHPNIPFDRRDPDVLERVRSASREMMVVCVEAGGTITGEHGVGLDKRGYMPLIYSIDDLQTMRWVKQSFDPTGLCNPGKLLPEMESEPSSAPETAVGEQRRSPDRASPRRIRPGSIATAIEFGLGSDCLADDPESFLIDGRPAEVAATPGSVEELAELMRVASREGWRVLPAGHGGWLDTGRPLRRPALVVTTRRLDSLVRHEPEDLLATVQAGMSLRSLGERLAEAGQWWPLDPLGGGTVGAIVATGSSGPLALGYGTPRDLVLGLTVVLADGRTVRAGGRVVKNVAGYDMVKLYTGSWGTLGIVAKANLRLYARPSSEAVSVFRAERSDALAALADRMASGDELAPAACEILSPSAARPAGGGSERWLMLVRWLGHPVAVGSAVSSSRDEASDLSCQVDGNDPWRGIEELEDRLDSALTVRVDVPLRAVPEFIRAATPFSGGQLPPLMAAPVLGRIWIFIPGPLYATAAGAERQWALRVEELRRAAVAQGGLVRVERAPPDLRAILDPWGLTPGAAGLGARLRARFDPAGVLKAGFFDVE